VELPLATSQPEAIRSQLGLWDAISIIIGIIIGATIYQTAPFILQNVSGPWTGLWVWVLGGLLTLVGALCFAELAAAYPHCGGDYIYQTRAYGRAVGFAFAWAQLVAVRTAGGIGALAYVFGNYARQLWDLGPHSSLLYAALAIVILSLINVLGVTTGKRTQNVLTAAKVLGLGGVLVVGLLSFFWPQTEQPRVQQASASSGSFALAMVLVLYAYSGWNEAAYVAAELRNRRRNIVLALVFATVGVTVIYVLVNAAYIVALGFDGARTSHAVAADVLRIPLGESGSKAMSLLVVISALGAVNGMIFTGSRVYSAFGADHSVFALMGRWNPRLGAPVWSLVIQAIICLAMVVLVEFSQEWRSQIARLATTLGLTQIVSKSTGTGGFEALVICTSPVFWLFLLLSGLSLFVLRYKDRDIERPFRVPAYPLVPLLFCASCGYMLYSSIEYAYKNAREESLVVALLMLAGIPFYLVSRSRAMPNSQAGTPGPVRGPNDNETAKPGGA
jgi:APA family basic amino acid/polyamine antiporter